MNSKILGIAHTIFGGACWLVALALQESEPFMLGCIFVTTGALWLRDAER